MVICRVIYSFEVNGPIALSWLKFITCRGWSGGAMVLGKLPVPERPSIWMTVGQGPVALAVGAGGFVFLTFLLSSVFSLFFLPLFGRRPDID